LLKLAPQAAVNIIPVPRHEVDFSNPSAVAKRIEDERDVDVVVNAVAYTAVDQAEREAALARSVNATAPCAIAHTCAKFGIPMVHVSTDYVFDGRKTSPYVETDPVSPINVYGHTKCEGEELIRSTLPHHVIVRTSWLYASHGKNFVKTILRLAFSQSEVKVIDDQWGNPTSAADLASSVLSIVKRIALTPDDNCWGTFHYTGSGRTNWYHFAKTVVDEASNIGLKVGRIVPIPSREYTTIAKRPTNSELDCTKFESVYGISPQPWFKSVKTVIDEILAQ
jgi:dTDP-4-dehydrorhamnose reductase